MTVQRLRLGLALTLCASLLAACGGGGGDTPSNPGTPTATTFALATGYKARITAGSNNTFAVSDGCSGTSHIVFTRAENATFEGIPGLRSDQTTTTTFTNCSPASATTTGSTYYNVSAVPIGVVITGGDYAAFTSNMSDFPATVRVGDSGIVSTMNVYSNSSKTTLVGKREVSYVIESDTSTTAIANIIVKTFNTGNQLLSTEQTRYRMTESGTLTIRSIDVVFTTVATGTSSTLHLLFTPT